MHADIIISQDHVAVYKKMNGVLRYVRSRGRPRTTARRYPHAVQFDNLEGDDYHDDDSDDASAGTDSVGSDLENMPAGPTYHGGDGVRDDNGPDTERLYAPNDDVTLMGVHQRRDLIDAIERERLVSSCEPDPTFAAG